MLVTGSDEELDAVTVARVSPALSGLYATPYDVPIGSEVRICGRWGCALLQGRL
jgi:hypothetical protein